jgi:thioredoxin reductase
VNAVLAGSEVALISLNEAQLTRLAARGARGRAVAGLARDPNRRNLRDHAAWFEEELRRLGVQLVLGNVVTANELVDFEADVVVVATGARPLVPDVPGIADPRVVTALDVLDGAPVGSAALVVGEFEKHLGPPTVAEFLADGGAGVELVSQQFDFASGAEDGTRLPLRQRLARKGVTVSLLHRLVEVDGTGAVVEDTLTRERRHLTGVTVVLACGSVPDDRLAKDLRGRIPEVHVVGDALAPRRMMHATLEGARVALAI